MKRLIALLTVGLACLAFQALSNCAQPLDDSSQLIGPISGSQPSGDTVFIYDTVILVDSSLVVDTIIIIDTIISGDTLVIIDTIVSVDTVIVVDSITIVDTVIIVDTIIIVDTVVVTLPDTSATHMVCSRLGSNQQEIVWLFRNEAGLYALEFSSLPDRDKPARTLYVTIGDQEYEWPLAESLEFLTEQTLVENAVIILRSSKPSSYGHVIDICIDVTRLEAGGD